MLRFFASQSTWTWSACHLEYPQTIAAIYKERWQVELFFKWIKQNLKIRSFLGNSKNAILTQIWIALCTSLLIAFIKFSGRIQGSTQNILRLLQLNLFMRRELLALLRNEQPPDKLFDDPQLRMAV